ncbi:glycosyltransferase family 2 protein [Plastorhodobacter daqingensis]|uniref:Glycosyltransferase family 2 protein n=1 Tax=Plastorhodobacter daqingensis TaxID=1387281 RepID=A0ABW2UDF8_9RHOB
MTERPATASVIVVSRGRPAHLRLCLLGLMQQDHPAFEVIVVADGAGLAQVQDLGLAAKTCHYEIPNISAARNLGILRAAGEVVAFIDDDAVPEPTWLSRLAAPFADRSVAAAGGFVRGRNGISFQWRAQTVDETGHAAPLDIPRAGATLAGRPGRAIKTEGTNCAFRTDLLCEIGGFDPSYTFYLDETDVNMRLAARGALTAIVPLAQVHHGTAPSGRRRANRAPLTLVDIGASTAVFLRRHATPEVHDAALDRLRLDQRRRLLRHMVAGTLEPRDVRHLQHTLEAGIAEGRVRALPVLAPLPDKGSEPFLPLPDTGPRPGRLFSGWRWQRERLRQQARAARAKGEVATILCLDPGPGFHRMRFLESGIWEQQGGLCGRSEREGPLIRFWRFECRVAAELQRLAELRAMN